MTYAELKLKYPKKRFGLVHIQREWRESDSCRRKYPVGAPIGGVVECTHKESKDHEYIDEGWSIYLEHSCDEWVIGDVKAAGTMVADLKEAISFCNENP